MMIKKSEMYGQVGHNIQVLTKQTTFQDDKFFILWKKYILYDLLKLKVIVVFLAVNRVYTTNKYYQIPDS